MIPTFSFVGHSGSGKTTLLCQVISHLKRKGYRVGTLKHDAHRFEMDHPGKDTWKHAQAGADVVAISSDEKFAMIEKPIKKLSFEEVINRIENVDIILVEGYKQELPPKILVVRDKDHLSLLKELPDVIAVATTLSFSDDIPVPVFSVYDDESIAHFIESKAHLNASGNR